MLKNVLVRARRRLPAIAGVAALLVGLVAVQFGFGSGTSTGDTSLAAADASSVSRTDSQTATRGAARTPESLFPAASAAIQTTTTEAPTTTTTQAPTTTTTAAPTTTTTAKAQAASTGGHSQTGGASYYAYKAGGCAHKTLPKGTTVTVTNLSNGKTTTCVVNDRGPFVTGRIIDLDTTVFKQVASTSAGVFQARISW